MAADFPEDKPYRSGTKRISGYRSRRSTGTVVLGVLAILLIVAMTIGWLAALYFLIHGVYIHDLWQVITGGVIIVVLLIIRALGS